MAKENRSAIFQNENGDPRRFYILPCELKAELRTLIEAGGGCLSSKFVPGAIKLVEPGTCNADKSYKNYVSTDFIFKCVQEGQFLNQENFRIEKDKVEVGKQVQPSENDRPSLRVQSSVVSYSLVSGRQAYSPEEDQAIVDFVKQNCKGKLTIGGNLLWRNAEARRVTLHTWQSMRDRFLKHLQPRKKLMKNKQEVVTVSKYFGKTGSQKKSKGYKALNVVAKAQQARARRNETAASHTTDDALSVNGDGHEKPPTRQKQLLSRQRSNKTSIEKQTCAVAEEQEMEEMPGAKTVPMEVVSNGSWESESNESVEFDKKLIAAAQQHMKTQSSSQEIGEDSSSDDIKDFSTSSRNDSEPVVSSSQDKQTESISEGAECFEKTNSQFGLSDFVGTVNEKMKRKHIKDTHLDEKGAVCVSERNGKLPLTSTPKPGAKDSPAVAISRDEYYLSPYKSGFRKRKNSSGESEDATKLHVLESCSESESDSESQSVLPKENNHHQLMAELVREDVALQMAQGFKELLSINDASVATITYTLFMSTGSIEATRKYLETGNIPADLWTWEEDQMLDTREINKVIQKRGLKSVNERVEFLSGN